MAKVKVTGCATVTLLVGGQRRGPLLQTRDVDGALLRALGLPARYGW